MAKASASKPASAPVRKPAEIESDIVETRERLVGTITELEDRVNPSKVANRGANKVKAFYVGDCGVRWRNVAITAGAVVGGVVAIRVVSVSFLPGFGISEAASMLVGQAVGANDD